MPEEQSKFNHNNNFQTDEKHCRISISSHYKYLFACLFDYNWALSVGMALYSHHFGYCFRRRRRLFDCVNDIQIQISASFNTIAQTLGITLVIVPITLPKISSFGGTPPPKGKIYFYFVFILILMLCPSAFVVLCFPAYRLIFCLFLCSTFLYGSDPSQYAIANV